MKNNLQTSTRIGFGTAVFLMVVSGVSAAENLAELSRLGDRARVRTILKSGANLDTRDAMGNTALHWAALNGDARLVQDLLNRGAQVDATNTAGATPLMYAVGNTKSVKALLEKGADVNHVSNLKGTPLMAAVLRPGSSEVVQLLLERGGKTDLVFESEMDIYGANLVDIAGFNGDLASVEMLLAAGVKPTGVSLPAWKGHKRIVETLLAAGADPEGSDVFLDHSLNISLFGQNPEIAKLLIEKGVDLSFRSPLGQHETPPMLWAAYNETDEFSVAQLLIEKGVDPNAESFLGETALDWARARGNAKLAQVLVAAGGRTGSKSPKLKSIPSNPLPSDEKEFNVLIRDAIDRSLNLLQRNSDRFLNTGSVKKQKCISCHQQSLPAVAYGRAIERGFPVDRVSIARQIQDQIRYWSTEDQISKAYEMNPPQPAASMLLGYGLQGLSAVGYQADRLTDSMVWYLAATQMPNGSWESSDYRPPMEDGPIVGTAFALRSLQLYPIAGLEGGMEPLIRKARRYLRRANPVNLNQQVFQLLGLGWAGENNRRLRPFAQAIIDQQRSDGGWSQLKGLRSDAWATGIALMALHETGMTETTDPVYRMGIQFLLRTQFSDGSWYVKSRAWPFQSHFESGFPHGKDQWISAGGTAWATIALLATQPLVGQGRADDWLSIKVPNDYRRPDETAPVRGGTNVDATVVFERDIEPIFKRSCDACHGDEVDKKKGGFDISARENFLIGGHSSDPVAVIGKGASSPLIRMVADRLEDLEMPPLSKRDEYPKLTDAEIELLKSWIDQGLVWGHSDPPLANP